MKRALAAEHILSTSVALLTKNRICLSNCIRISGARVGTFKTLEQMAAYLDISKVSNTIRATLLPQREHVGYYCRDQDPRNTLSTTDGL